MRRLREPACCELQLLVCYSQCSDTSIGNQKKLQDRQHRQQAAAKLATASTTKPNGKQWTPRDFGRVSSLPTCKELLHEQAPGSVMP